MAAVTDLEGFTYLQREGNGVLLGVYEQHPRHWAVDGAPWDFGRELFPEELDRIMPELSIGFERFPVLQDVGIKRWVNGAFTFTPDGNPLVGPVAGRPELLGGLRRDGRVLPGRGRSGSRSRTGSSTATPATTCSAWTSRGSAPYALERALPARHHRAVLRAPVRHGLPERGAARRRGRSRRRLLRRVLAAEGARFTVNWGLEVPLYFAPSAGLRGERHAGPVQRRAARRRRGRGRAHRGRRVRDRAVRAVRGHRARRARRGSTTCSRRRIPDRRAHPPRADAERGRAADGRPHRQHGSTTTASG